MRSSSSPVKRAVLTEQVCLIGASGEQQLFSKEEVEALLRRQAEGAHRDGEAAGYQRGFSDGLAKGREEEQQRLAARAAQLERLVEAILDEKEALFRESEAEVIELALTVAAKVIRREIKETSPAAALAAEAIRRAIDRRAIRVHVHPDDYEMLMGEADRLTGRLKGIERLELVVEDSIKPGGCLVETNAGGIDARLDRQLDEIRRALIED